MSKLFENVKFAMGFGMSANELYSRAWESMLQGEDFKKAAELFNEAAKRASAENNRELAARAAANALLYSYLTKKDVHLLEPLVKALGELYDIEQIGLPQQRMQTGPLRAELECRRVEALIANIQDDVVRLRDLHKMAADRFQALLQRPLITYEYVKSGVGPDERADARFFYHQGMYQFYEAMTKKDRDPATAADDLALAQQAFRRCNDERWLDKVTQLLNNWRVARTCWLCHREVQGHELHFSMCRATVTPYTKRLLETLNQDVSSAQLKEMRVAVCTPCGSMITFKAAEEADKVRKELTEKLDVAFSRIQALEDLVNKLQWNHQ
jgi:hypothetical protein